MASVMREYLLLLASVIVLMSTTVHANGRHDRGEALGTKKFAVVLLDYANDGSAPSIDTLKKGFFDAPASTQNYLAEVSYGKMQFHAEFFGWIVPPKPLFGEGWTNCWPIDQDRFNLLLQENPRVDLEAYDGFIFYVNRKKPNTCGAGIANTYGLDRRPTYASPEWLDTRIIYLATEFYFPSDYGNTTNSTVTHEILHGLGISNHSSSIHCTNGAVITPNLIGCEIIAYGDLFSAMGSRSQAGHPNVIDKERLEWLNPSQIKTVTQTQRFRLHALEKNDSALKAIKIPLEIPIRLNDRLAIDTLYIEYRGMTGFDQRNDFFRRPKLQDGSHWYQRNIHGALVYGADCKTHGYCIPYLLNMNPGSVAAKYLPNNLINAYLFPGRVFKMPLNSVRIESLKVLPGKYLDIKVTI